MCLPHVQSEGGVQHIKEARYTIRNFDFPGMINSGWDNQSWTFFAGLQPSLLGAVSGKISEN
jgi:hypothetical protein